MLACCATMFSKEKQGSFELTHVTHMREAEIRLSKGESISFYWTWDYRMGMVSRFYAEPAQRRPPL